MGPDDPEGVLAPLCREEGGAVRHHQPGLPELHEDAHGGGLRNLQRSGDALHRRLPGLPLVEVFEGILHPHPEGGRRSAA